MYIYFPENFEERTSATHTRPQNVISSLHLQSRIVDSERHWLPLLAKAPIKPRMRPGVASIPYQRITSSPTPFPGCLHRIEVKASSSDTSFANANHVGNIPDCPGSVQRMQPRSDRHFFPTTPCHRQCPRYGVGWWPCTQRF